MFFRHIAGMQNCDYLPVRVDKKIYLRLFQTMFFAYIKFSDDFQFVSFLTILKLAWRAFFTLASTENLSKDKIGCHMLNPSHYLCLTLLCSGCAVAVASDVAPNVLNATPAAVEQAERRLRVDTDGGVIVNQAITVAGQDFYQYFSAAWRDKEGSEHFTLAIRERPSARWGSEIWVEYGQRRIFHAYLPPARAAIRTLSENAADIAYQAAMQADIQRLLMYDADLGRDEF